MIPDKELKKLKEYNYPDSVIEYVNNFLEEKGYEYYNLAFLGKGEYRIMYRDKEGKVNCEIFKH